MEVTATRDRVLSEAYSMIKSEHPCWPVIIYGIIITLVTITGMLSNVSVIFVTIRTKSYRGSMHILLAFYSFGEIVHLSANFLSIFTAFSGQYFMQLKKAVYFVIVPFIGGGCAINLMFFIGIERLFVVLFPLKKFNHKIFLAIVFNSNLIYIIGLYAIISSKCANNEFSSTEILRNYYEIAQIIGDCSNFTLFGLIIMIITAIVYILIAVTLHCRKDANSAQYNSKIFRSLFTILSVNLGGYLITFLSFFLIKPMVQHNAMVLWHAIQIFGILLNISASSNGPILYLTSSEYREAFQKTYAIFSKVFGKNSAVVPQPLFTRNVPMKNSIQTKF